MKKLLLICLPALFSAISISTPITVVNEKVLKVFHEAFPDVKQPSWHTFDTYYEVFFTNPDNSSCRINYSFNGAVLSTNSYYDASKLCPFIKARVTEKYPGKKIFGITEVASGREFTYHIILEDDKHWYNIKSDAIGNIRLERKFHRAEQ